MKRRSFLKTMGSAALAAPFTGCHVLPKRRPGWGRMPRGDMPMVTLGKTGIKVSRLGFGSHLTKELMADPERRDGMIKTGFEQGINTFDVYEHGYEQYAPMGKSLKDFRDETVISLLSFEPIEKMQQEIDGGLKAFYTDYIDLFRLYKVDDDRIAFLEKNKKAGKMRAIGVAAHDEAILMKYLDDYGDVLDYVMIVYNFHHHNAGFKKGAPDNDYTALIPRLKRMGLGILGMKPMGSDRMVELVLREGFSENQEANPFQAMLRYVFRGPAIDCVMPAMNSMSQLSQDLEAAYRPAISPAEEALLGRISKAAAATKGAYLSPDYRWLENWASPQLA